MKWIDLSTHNVALIPAKLKSGKTCLLIIGEGLKGTKSEKESLRSANFIPSSVGYWFSTKYSTDTGTIRGVTLDLFKKTFPKAFVREMTADEVKTGNYPQQPAVPSVPLNSAQSALSTPSANKPVTAPKAKGMTPKEAKRIEIDLNQIQALGINELNEKVYQNAGERFVVDAVGSRAYEDNGYFANARYLRAGRATNIDGPALSSCMHGLINQIKNGVVLSESDIEHSAKVFFDIDSWDNIKDETKQKIKRFVQVAIESAIVQEVEKGVSRYADFKGRVSIEAQEMYDRRPTMDTGNKWHRDLPPDIALLANNLIKDSDKNIILPFANQGGSILGVVAKGMGKNVRALMDAQTPAYAKYFKIGSELDISYDKFNYHTDNLADRSADFVMGAMPGTTEVGDYNLDRHKTTRLDHFYASKILNSLKENGTALITVDADGVDGEINNDGEAFLTWLYENFKIKAVADLDGGLYSKQGDYKASRLIIVQGRHLVPVKVNLPEKLRVLHSRTSVYSFIEDASVIKDDNKVVKNADSVDTESLSEAMSRIGGQRGEEIQLNEYQGRYIAMSSLGEASSMVPKNITEPIRMCFARFMKDCGKVDDFVMDKLQMDADEMKLAFSPEQIDSIGLAIWRNETKLKGFLVGDQTGKGKGRIIAGLLRYSALQGKRSVFVTKDADLFQDMYRDIQDIGSSHLFEPYLVNDKAIIHDNDGNIVAKGSNANNKVYIDADEAPDNNLIMTSYSQLNLRPKPQIIGNTKFYPPNKPEWHYALAEDSMLILDESHLAAGQSNTNKIVDEMLERNASTVYSSATFSRHAKSMAIYRKLFPDTLDAIDIKQALIKGKEPLQEILSATLVSDGGMLRREHDFSKLEINTVYANDYKERNEDATDAFAKFLSGFAALTGEIEGATVVINKKIINNIHKQQIKAGMQAAKLSPGRDIGYQSMSFGSQLHNLTKQFVLALNVDAAADHAIQAVKEGRKPVLGVENTGEALIKHLREMNDEDVVFSTMPSIRDLLKRVVQRNLMVLHTSASGKKEYLPMSSVLDKEKAEYVEEQVKELLANIDNIPALPFSPIDVLTNKMEKAGLKVGEISGRNTFVAETDKGYIIKSKKKSNKNEVVAAFNEGYIDAVITTKSGATGISMHAYEKFADQNQRELIEVQVFDDIVDRIQLLGRVNRKGQVCEPVISSVDACVPAQTRLLAMANTKLARMSANTTANRDNANAIDTIDILNNVGDTVCQRYLESSPTLRKRLFIKEEDIEDNKLQKGYENSLSRTVTSRLLLLPCKEQNRIYEDLDFEFNAYIRECEAQGYNPLKRREMDVKATESKRQLLSGVSKTFYESEFERPVEIVSIVYDVEKKALKANTVIDMVTNGRRRVYQDVRLDIDDECLIGMQGNIDKVSKGLILDTFSEHAKVIAMTSVTNYQDELELALKSKLVNATQKLVDRLNYLKETLEVITVGSLVKLSDFSASQEGVIVDIRLPRSGNEHMLAQYELSIATPNAGIQMRSLADMYYTIKADVLAEEFELGTGLAGEFERTNNVSIKQERHLLSGNMFEAARFAGSHNMGSPIIYTDTTGARIPAVLLAHDVSPSKLLSMPFAFDSAKKTADYLRCFADVNMKDTLEYKYNKSVVISRNPHNLTQWKFTVPKNKSHGEMFFANTNLINNTAGGFSVMRNTQVAYIDDHQLDDFMKGVGALGVKLLSSKYARTWSNEYDAGRVNVPKTDQDLIDSKNSMNALAPI